MDFSTSRGSLYNRNVPSFTRPYIVGYMSVDISRQYHGDLSQLKYIVDIPCGKVALDLNHNIHKAIKRTTDDNDEKISLMLKFLLDHKQLLKSQMNDPLFVTYRRTLISVMCNAFDNSEPLSIVATLFKDCIYLCLLETPQEIQRRKSRTPQQNIFCAWGYKFEQYMCADHPSFKPNTEKPVIENEEFSIYYTARFGDHELLYGAQIDGMLATNGQVSDPPDTTDPETNINYLRHNEFIELKTNRLIENRRQENNFKKYKLMRCWCQCYLAGLKGLLVGFRNDQGLVQQLQWFETDDLVKYCKHVWAPETALTHLNYFLSYVKMCFRNYENKSNGPISLQFDFDGTAIKMSEVKDHNNTILPDWYIESMNK